MSIYFTALQLKFKFHLGFLSTEAGCRAAGYIQEERKTPSFPLRKLETRLNSIAKLLRQVTAGKDIKG